MNPLSHRGIRVGVLCVICVWVVGDQLVGVFCENPLLVIITVERQTGLQTPGTIRSIIQTHIFISLYIPAGAAADSKFLIHN